LLPLPLRALLGLAPHLKVATAAKHDVWPKKIKVPALHDARRHFPTALKVVPGWLTFTAVFSLFNHKPAFHLSPIAEAESRGSKRFLRKLSFNESRRARGTHRGQIYVGFLSVSPALRLKQV
jgi:hypothetical protein